MDCEPCPSDTVANGTTCEPCVDHQNADGFYWTVETAKACVITADLNGGYDTRLFSNQESSSAYFVVDDSDMGPTTRSWWTGERELIVPVRSEFGHETELILEATKQDCGADYGYTNTWGFNAGALNWDCDYYAHLEVDVAANPDLEFGERYVGLEDSPLVIIGKRWHTPEADAITGVIALRVEYSF